MGVPRKLIFGHPLSQTLYIVQNPLFVARHNSFLKRGRFGSVEANQIRHQIVTICGDQSNRRGDGVPACQSVTRLPMIAECQTMVLWSTCICWKQLSSSCCRTIFNHTKSKMSSWITIGLPLQDLFSRVFFHVWTLQTKIALFVHQSSVFFIHTPCLDLSSGFQFPPHAYPF